MSQDRDFREAFARMDAAALIDSRELAALLCTSEKNIAVMKTRGQLPPTAFPNRRLNKWRVGTIRRWQSSDTENMGETVVAAENNSHSPKKNSSKTGRRRLPADELEG